MQPCLNEPESESKSEDNFKDSLSVVLSSIKEKYPELEGKDFVGIFWGLQDPSSNNIDGIPATDSDLDSSIERSNSSLLKTSSPSLHGGHRPGSIASNHENPLSGNQQKRSIVTIMPPLDEPKFEDNFKDFFNLILKKEYPGMEDPEWVGAHATSSKNMEGIVENGFDFSRCGTNWYGYSKFGPGLYTTHDPFHMVLFATEAAKGKSDADMKNALQLAMVFRSGPDEGEVDVDGATTLPTLSDDDQPDPARDIIIGKWVPSEVALSKSTRYMMVPLPPFSKSDSDNIKTWLEEGLQKAGLTQALKTEPDK